MSRLGKIYIVAGVAALSVVAIACGGNGASNNDQGMSVTFLGLFNSTNLSEVGGGGGGGGITPGNQGCGQLPSVFVGGSFRLGEAEPEPNNSTTDTNLSGTNEAGAYVSVVGVQNNLYGQVFRADRVYIDYYIPGASAQPPSTSVPVSLLAGPAESAASNVGAGGGTTGSTVRDPGIRRPAYTSLPPSLANICNRALAQVTVVPAAVREWLNFNRDRTPEAPYKMEVTIRVSGLTSAGDRLDTNDGTFDFEILPETLVVPTDGVATPAATPGDTTSTVTQVDQLGVRSNSEQADDQDEDFNPPSEGFETQSSYEGQEE